MVRSAIKWFAESVSGKRDGFTPVRCVHLTYNVMYLIVDISGRSSAAIGICGAAKEHLREYHNGGIVVENLGVDMKNPVWCFAVVVLLISGCSGSDPVQTDNWYRAGYRDGIAYHHQRTYKVLSALDVTQQSDYDKGYSEGIKTFCNPDFAYQIGLSGQYYDGVCDGTPSGNRFRLEWRRGWQQFNQ